MHSDPPTHAQATHTHTTATCLPTTTPDALLLLETLHQEVPHLLPLGEGLKFAVILRPSVLALEDRPALTYTQRMRREKYVETSKEVLAPGVNCALSYMCMATQNEEKYVETLCDTNASEPTAPIFIPPTASIQLCSLLLPTLP